MSDVTATLVRSLASGEHAFKASHGNRPRGLFTGVVTAVIASISMFAFTSASLARVDLDPAPAGVATETGSELVIALPIQNQGDEVAYGVMVSDVRLRSGRLDQPSSLPQDLGTVVPDQSAVLDLRFGVPHLDPSRTYDLEVAGHYHLANQANDHDQERESGHHEHEFYLHTVIHVPPFAPGSASASSNSGSTHQTNGPYPALPQPPQTENNEFRPPTPLGTPRTLYPPTPNSSGAQNAGPGASVGFVINTQSNGIANRFPPDPSAIGSGTSSNLVLATGNLYIKYSTDGGTTFNTISDLSTVFGDQPDGGYCCDQVVHYIPSIDHVVWLIQTNQSKDATGNVTGPNSLRVAWAKPADITANFYTAWTWFDVSSAFLGLGNDWLDFPDLSTANGHLYLSVDDVAQNGLVVARISYADMQLPGGSIVTWDFTDPTKSTAAESSHLTQNVSDTMYWAGHNTTSQLRAFSWSDNSNQYSWRDVSNTNYSTSDYTSKAPDGQYWLDPRPKGDSIIGAAKVPFVGLVEPGQPTPPDQIWLAWDAGRDTTFAQPYIRMAMIDTAAFNNVGEYEVWNPGYAFAYPALAVNGTTSDVAISLMWGGGDNYMNNAVGFIGDFSAALGSYVVYDTTASDVTFTSDPKTSTACDDASNGLVAGRCTRSGDFLSVRRVGTETSLFGTLGYEINLVDSTKSTDCLVAPGCVQNVRWIEFGRAADVNPSPPPLH